MDVDQEFETSIINAGSFFLFMLTIVGIGIGITFLMANISIMLIPVGVIIFWIGPLIFSRKLRILFLKKLTIEFSNKKIVFKIFNRRSKALEKQFDISYNQIEAFKIYNSIKDDSSYLKIVCKDRARISYTFVGQSKQSKNTEITSLLLNYIHRYNDECDPNDKIKLLPSLFASKKGSVYIVFLFIVLTGLIICQIIFKPKSIPFSILISIILTLQIISQRKRDLKDLKDFERVNSE